MPETWFCVYDVHYYDEDEYFPRHNKGLILVDSFGEAYKWLCRQFGEKQFDSVKMEWLDSKSENNLDEPKRDLNFTESEFDKFEMVKAALAEDKSYYDWDRLEKEALRKRQ